MQTELHTCLEPLQKLSMRMCTVKPVLALHIITDRPKEDASAAAHLRYFIVALPEPSI